VVQKGKKGLGPHADVGAAGERGGIGRKTPVIGSQGKDTGSGLLAEPTTTPGSLTERP
jgi:hypothetical protein